jgi:hypothetical protein
MKLQKVMALKFLSENKDTCVCKGYFIRPFGIADPCGTVAGMVTPKGSMSTEGETLQASKRFSTY